jgi:hypothetical protein
VLPFLHGTIRKSLFYKTNPAAGSVGGIRVRTLLQRGQSYAQILFGKDCHRTTPRTSGLRW